MWRDNTAIQAKEICEFNTPLQKLLCEYQIKRDQRFTKQIKEETSWILVKFRKCSTIHKDTKGKIKIKLIRRLEFTHTKAH